MTILYRKSLSEMSAQEQALIAEVEAGLSFPYRDVMEEFDWDACRETIIQCKELGFNVDETRRYIKCLEHYNPELREDFALKRMSAIYKEVAARTGKQPWKKG